MKIKKQIEANDLFELKHEEFIDNPKYHLKELCSFLGVNTPHNILYRLTGGAQQPLVHLKETCSLIQVLQTQILIRDTAHN